MIKKFKLFEKHEDIDPYGEEDWDDIRDFSEMSSTEIEQFLTENNYTNFYINSVEEDVLNPEAFYLYGVDEVREILIENFDHFDIAWGFIEGGVTEFYFKKTIESDEFIYKFHDKMKYGYKYPMFDNFRKIEVMPKK